MSCKHGWASLENCPMCVFEEERVKKPELPDWMPIYAEGKARKHIVFEEFVNGVNLDITSLCGEVPPGPPELVAKYFTHDPMEATCAACVSKYDLQQGAEMVASDPKDPYRDLEGR